MRTSDETFCRFPDPVDSIEPRTMTLSILFCLWVYTFSSCSLWFVNKNCKPAEIGGQLWCIPRNRAITVCGVSRAAAGATVQFIAEVLEH